MKSLAMLFFDLLMLLRILLAFVWLLPLMLGITFFNHRKAERLGIIYRDFIRELRLL